MRKAVVRGSDENLYTLTGSTPNAVTENGARGIVLMSTTLRSIVVKSPLRISYSANEIVGGVAGLDLEGLVVMADYGGGVRDDISSLIRGAPGDYLAVTIGNDLTSVGEKTITVVINGISWENATFKVEVHG